MTGLGAAVADLAVGDEVIGLIDFDRDGAAVEYVVMPAASLAAKRIRSPTSRPRRCRSRR
jgi:NADPH:quinone reductase-like Zn-dependent oxidoreductase